MARGSSAEIPGRRVRMIFLVYCIAALFFMYLCCLLPLRDINFPTFMAQYRLFVLKVPLNPKQAIVSEMTYTVSSETLNSSIPYHTKQASKQTNKQFFVCETAS